MRLVFPVPFICGDRSAPDHEPEHRAFSNVGRFAPQFDVSQRGARYIGSRPLPSSVFEWRISAQAVASVIDRKSSPSNGAGSLRMAV
jgi:hypothetical protein